MQTDRGGICGKMGKKDEFLCHGDFDGQQSGFTLIELIIAMALFVIILVPVLPLLSQARTNYNSAITRRIAQGQAVTLAVETRTNPTGADGILVRMADNYYGLVYRLTLEHLNGITQQHTERSNNLEGDVSIPPFEPTNFTASPPQAFENAIIIVAEIFDENGILVGFSVSKAE